MLKNNLADLVAADMASLLESEEYTSIFNKTAGKKKKDEEEDKKKAKDKKKKEDDKKNGKDKKNGAKDKDKKPGKKKSKAEQLSLAVQGIAKISEILDDLNLIKSASLTLRALEQIVIESASEEFVKNAKKKKDDDDEEDEEDEEDDDEDEKKDDKKEKKEDKKKDEKDEDEDKNDDRVNYGILPVEERTKAREYKPKEHYTKAPVKEAPKPQPKPELEREYKHPWEREKFEIQMADDGTDDCMADDEECADDGNEVDDSNDERGSELLSEEERTKALEYKPKEHYTKAPVKEAPKPQPKPELKREYKHPWEREKIELQMTDDENMVDFPDYPEETEEELGEEEGRLAEGLPEDEDLDPEELEAIMDELGGVYREYREESDENTEEPGSLFNTAAKKDKKWIQKAVKKPGRFEGWSLSKMKSRYNTLKDKKDKSKSENSEMKALALGIRFKGSDVPGGKKKKGL